MVEITNTEATHPNGYGGVRRELLTTKKSEEIPAFGKLLKKHLRRAGMTQEEFGDRMTEDGYPHRMTQQDVSYLINNRVRVYPQFFLHARKVLGLSAGELADLLWVYGVDPPLGGDQNSG